VYPHHFPRTDLPTEFLRVDQEPSRDNDRNSFIGVYCSCSTDHGVVATFTIAAG
jgi:hypothetical protein